MLKRTYKKLNIQGWLSILLKSLALNWVRYQIRPALEMDNNTKAMFWMYIKLIDGIQLVGKY